MDWGIGGRGRGKGERNNAQAERMGVGGILEIQPLRIT